MKMLSVVLLSSLSVAVPSISIADVSRSETVKAGVPKIEEVVVTAVRYEKKESSVPADITVITRKDIRNSTAGTIPDILRNQAGIQVKDIAGNNRNFVVDLRGFGETASLNTLVLVDGRRVNQSDLSGTDWVQIPLDRVRKIEIVRGGRGSVLYGDNASGGVINIITEEGDATEKGVDFRGGSYDTFKGRAYLSGSTRDLSYALSGNYLTSDGYRENSGIKSKDLGMKLNYYLSDFTVFNFSSGYHKDETGLPGALRESDFSAGAARTDAKYSQNFANVEDYYFQAGPEFYFAGNSILKVDASFRKRGFHSFSSFVGGNFTGDTHIKTFAVSPGLLIKNKIGRLNNDFSAGFDIESSTEDISNNSLFFGTLSKGVFKLEKSNYGIYAQDEIALSENLFLSGGYRYDKVDFDFTPGTPKSVSHEKKLFTAGINYNFKNKSYVYFNLSKGFRYPVMDELFSFFNSTVSTALIPQTSLNYEFGVENFFSDALSSRINLYRVDTDDEIFFNPSTFKNENLDGMNRRDGIEVSFTVKHPEWITLKASYTYLEAKIRSGQFRGKTFPGVAKHKATFESILSLGDSVSFALNGNYMGGQHFISDFSNTFARQAGYLVMNAKLKYSWKGVKLFLDARNITDREYSEYGVLGTFPSERAFYPSPKINFLLGVTADL